MILVSAIRQVIENSATAGQIFNIGSLYLTWEKIAAMIIELTESSSNIQFITPEEWRGPSFLNETWDLGWDKATDTFGYQPQYATQESMLEFREALLNTIMQLNQ